MKNENSVMFTCSECNKQFEPDPDTMVELHSGTHKMTSEQMQELYGDNEIETISFDELSEMNEYQLKEIGMTPEERDQILKGEDVVLESDGAICVCKECQDKLLAEQYPNDG